MTCLYKYNTSLFNSVYKMASNKNKKSELISLYRLEFYKNKKQWKLSSEKAKEPAKPPSEPRDTASSKLDETYTTDPVWPQEEKAPSTINNAFLHEMPTDETSPRGIVTTSSQTYGPKPDLVSTSVPQCVCTRNSQPQDYYKDWSTGQDYLDQQPLNTQNPDIWPNNFQDGTDSSQPVDSLQWLLKTASLSWTQNSSPEDFQPPSNVDHVDAWTEASQKIQPQYRYVENNSTQKLQFNLEKLDLYDSEEYPANPAPDPVTPRFTRNTTDPATPYQKPSTPDQWHEQRNSLKYPDIWPTHPASGPSGSTAGVSSASAGLPRSMSGAANVSGNIRMSEKDVFDLCNERPQFFIPDVWENQIQNYAESSRPDSWTCPAPPSTPEASQNIWTNQLWQEEQQYWRNSDKEWRNPPEEFCGEEDTPFPKMQYGAETRASADQFMVKPGPEEYTDVSPEQVHRHTNQWLRRLMGMYMENEDCIDPCDPLCDHLQHGCDSSAEFIRGAHDVAHSSENDTSELTECVCSPAAGRLCGASRSSLARATSRAAAALRLLLTEQMLRDQRRLETNNNSIPNRDSNLFAGEYVISGSHITRSDAELQMASADSVIKIKMGRPYRLERNCDN